ncbi:MAG TPA: glycosyltransferase family 2 protein [Chloroflexi bacterium]|nr:MAG: hypothetical protein B6243_12970 [Anaerolineaceae bacterium 4572_5.2]HEY84557.1 glycosyltransferase family 2 protein [Chloroflexota bacterium]
MTLSVIIVNWNVKDLLRQCLQSVIASEIQGEVEIIVVDSASGDGSAAMVRQEFPRIKLIASDENLGYAKGNNIGAAQASGDYLFLLNPDTRLEADTLATLNAYLQAHPGVGALAPQLLWPDGSTQSSRRRFPTLATLFWESTLLHQWFPRNKFARAYHCDDISPAKTTRVDWAVGAALFIRRKAWEQVGGLDETLFMYFEETDWQRRAAKAGWEVHYLPAAQVTHYEGQSSGQVFAARTIRFQRSKIRYTKKYFGKGWALTLRFFLWLTFAFQWGEETVKWVVGHKRLLRRERMSAYLEVLKQI